MIISPSVGPLRAMPVTPVRLVGTHNSHTSNAFCLASTSAALALCGREKRAGRVLGVGGGVGGLSTAPSPPRHARWWTHTHTHTNIYTWSHRCWKKVQLGESLHFLTVISFLSIGHEWIDKKSDSSCILCVYVCRFGRTYTHKCTHSLTHTSIHLHS